MLRCLIVAAAVCALAPAAAHGESTHAVAPGETLWGIAVANGLSTAALASANGLGAEDHVIAGTTLTVPDPGAASAAPSGGGYVVRAGDSITAVAATHGISPDQLAAANGLDATGWLLTGATLQIPAAGAASPAGSAAPEALGAYTVRPGDTLSALAATSGVPLAQMAYVNGLDPAEPLLAGTVLKLPTGAQVSSSQPAPATTIVPDANPLATNERLSAEQVRAIAGEHGVASLATAIAWQESGFNNAMISAANARGIMQILPGTWDWVQSNLAASQLNPASAHDNVRAGALYLARLMQQTGGDPALAAAAYYQGLASVQRIGMLPETRRYVDNVLALRSRFGG